MGQSPKILIILSSIREVRAGERVAQWIHNLAAKRTDMHAELVDLKAIDLPLYHYAKDTKEIEESYTDEGERAWVEKVNSADGFIIVTPEYNHGYPPSLKNALDYIYAGWNNKPVAFVSYGGAMAGSRATEQLRQVVIELQMAPIRAHVPIQFISKAFGPDGNPLDPRYAKLAGKMFNQLAWWANVLKEGRQNHPIGSS